MSVITLVHHKGLSKYVLNPCSDNVFKTLTVKLFYGNLLRKNLLTHEINVNGLIFRFDSFGYLRKVEKITGYKNISLY